MYTGNSLPNIGRGPDHVLPGDDNRALWVPLIGLVALLYYAIGFDQGVLQSMLGISIEDVGGGLHGFLHDGRHLIGFSCH